MREHFKLFFDILKICFSTLKDVACESQIYLNLEHIVEQKPLQNRFSVKHVYDIKQEARSEGNIPILVTRFALSS